MGSLVLAVLPELLERCDLPVWATSIAEARRALVQAFRSRGFEVNVGEGPWVLVEAPGLRKALVPHGLVVRDCQSFGLAGVVRVAVPDGDGLAQLERALDRAIGSGVLRDCDVGLGPVPT